MKKIALLMMTILTTVLIAACAGNGENAAHSQEPQPVSLNKDNITSYLEIEEEFGDVEEHELGFGGHSSCHVTADMTIRTFARQSGSFENVSITIRPNIAKEKNSKGETLFFLEEKPDSPLECSFNLPSSGSYSKSFSIKSHSQFDVFPKLDKYNTGFTIVSASGTFIPAY